MCQKLSQIGLLDSKFFWNNFLLFEWFLDDFFKFKDNLGQEFDKTGLIHETKPIC